MHHISFHVVVEFVDCFDKLIENEKLWFQILTTSTAPTTMRAQLIFLSIPHTDWRFRGALASNMLDTFKAIVAVVLT